MTHGCSGSHGFLDCVFAGIYGGLLGAAFLVSLPISLPLYALGRWVVIPAMNWFTSEGK